MELAVTGARVEPRGDGAQLVLEESGRRIAYNRLRVTDATGRELSARMDVVGGMCHWPVPSGDPPDGMTKAAVNRRATALPSCAAVVPPSGSPGGTGGSPVPPLLAVLVDDADARLSHPHRPDFQRCQLDWHGRPSGHRRPS